jgi:GntR family transcriptional repressor for pyruvate dehydrogenase complex
VIEGRETLKRSSLVDRIADRLREDILAGRYQPGSSLPPERELASRYGVNRTSVKHALVRLEQSGLIDIKHGIGSLVVDYGARGGAELLQYLLVRSGGIDRQLLGALLEVRAIMGGAIAHLAAQRTGPEDAAGLEQVLQKVERSLGEPAAVQACDMEFFRALAGATGNRALELLLNSVAIAYGKSAELLVHAFRDTESVRTGLCRILDRVEAGDAEGARAAAEAHLGANSARMLEGLSGAAPDG